MNEGARPLVIAHRGANEDEPEHSLASYLLAIKEGADGLECDVRLTRDGNLVLVHDRRIDRTTGKSGTVSRMSLGQLSRYDFSGGEMWRDFEAPPPDETRTGVLTLEALLAAALEASDSISFSIETKHPTRYAGYVERELADVLTRFGLHRPASHAESRVRMMSFSAMAVRRMQRLLPAIPTVSLMDRIWRRHRDGSLPTGTRIAGINVQRLHDHPDYVSRVHERGGAVHCWTVDDPNDVRLCMRLGVDAIISNRPGMVRALLAGQRLR